MNITLNLSGNGFKITTTDGNNSILRGTDFVTNVEKVKGGKGENTLDLSTYSGPALTVTITGGFVVVEQHGCRHSGRHHLAVADG